MNNLGHLNDETDPNHTSKKLTGFNLGEAMLNQK